MINYKSYIASRIQSVLNTDKKIIVEEPPKEEMGDFSVPCFELRNEELKNPVEVSNYLKANFIDENHYFKKIDVMGPN
jgi:arginyl-tRNA synthetase